MRGQKLLVASLFSVSVVACAQDDVDTTINDHEVPGVQEPGSATSQRGCQTIEPTDEQKAQTEQEMSDFLAARGNYQLAIAPVPVHIHRIHDGNGTGGDVTQQQINDQINVLN